jgi:hypothetical protein
MFVLSVRPHGWLGSHWTDLREILCIFFKLTSTSHSKVRLQSDESASFRLLVGETPKVIKCFKPKLLPAANVMQNGLNDSPALVFVTIYPFIPTRRPTAAVFRHYCNLSSSASSSLYGDSVRSRVMASLLPGRPDSWVFRKWECQLHTPPTPPPSTLCLTRSRHYSLLQTRRYKFSGMLPSRNAPLLLTFRRNDTASIFSV